MSLFDGFNGFATELLGTLGGPATLTRVTRAYDEVLDETVETNTTLTINAAFGPLTKNNAFGISESESVVRSDTALQAGDRVTMQGKTFIIEKVTEIAPDMRGLFWIGQVCQ